MTDAYHKYRLILIVGPNRSARLAALDGIKKEAAQDGETYDVFVAGDGEPARWYDNVSTAPFFGEYRTVMVRQLARIAAKKEYTLGLSHVPEWGRLVLVVDEESSDDEQRITTNTQGWIKAVKEAEGIVLNFPLPIKDEAKTSIEQRAKRHGLSFSKKAFELLMEMTGGQPLVAYDEIDRLVLITEPGVQVTEQDIKKYVQPDEEFSTFQLADAVLSGKAQDAVERLHWILSKSKKLDTEAHGKILPALSTKIAQVWQARAAIELRSSLNSPSKELMLAVPKKSGMTKASDWQIKQAMGAARNNDFERLKHIHDCLYEAEHKLKGMLPAAGIKETLESMVLKMCAGPSLSP